MMKKFGILDATIIFILLVAVLISCATQNSTSTHTSSSPDGQMPARESAELQPRGRGTVKLVKEPVYEGAYSAKLAIPEDYTTGDAARIAVPLDGFTLNDITSLSFWCYIDADTPENTEGYWVPYLTFELDTDGKPGCDTWVIGGRGTVQQNSSEWFENIIENDWLFHISSTFSDYASPFPLSKMGTLSEIKAAMGPDGATLLGDCIVSKIRLAIGNWGP